MIGLESLKWLSEQLGKPESTIRTWRRRGDIPIDCFKEIGGSVFVKVEKFKEWVEEE